MLVCLAAISMHGTTVEGRRRMELSHEFGVGSNYYRPPQDGVAVAHQLTRRSPVPQRPRPPRPFGRGRLRGRPGRPRGRPLVGRPIRRPLQPFGK